MLCRPSQQEAPKYSRLEAEISAMQRNSSTYCDQPEDAEEFAKWLEVCTWPRAIFRFCSAPQLSQCCINSHPAGF